MTDKGTISNHRAEPPRPIEFLTENGFSIIRLCDIDESIPAGGTKHSFLVRDPHGYELEITVDISDSAVAEIISRSIGRLSLADYLWDDDDYPPEARLKVGQYPLGLSRPFPFFARRRRV